MFDTEQSIETRIAVGAHTKVAEESALRSRHLRAAEAFANLIDLSDPTVQDSLKAAGLWQDGVSIADFRTEVVGCVGEAAAREEHIAELAAQDIRSIQVHPSEDHPYE